MASGAEQRSAGPHAVKGGNMQTGRIHSIETMGLVDGPGIRTVIFLQGCDLRCAYCHNPDTWSKGGKAANDQAAGGNAAEKSTSGAKAEKSTSGVKAAKEMTSAELTAKIVRFRSYFDASGGGVTFSGGEPLMQAEFLAEVMESCRSEGISICLDTAGCGHGDYDRILASTDLILYDVKHYTDDGYRKITGNGSGKLYVSEGQNACGSESGTGAERTALARTEDFLRAAEKAGVPMWVRHVVVPGITDSTEHIKGLKAYISRMPNHGNVKKIELLPYHLLGVNKYHEMGIDYRLEGVPAMDEDKTRELQHQFFE